MTTATLYSSHGWDLATPGLVQLGFFLMESSPGKGTSTGYMCTTGCSHVSLLLQMGVWLNRWAGWALRC